MAVITGSFNSLVSGTITGVFQNTAGGVLSGVIGTPGPAGVPGQGVPVGGSTGQALVKIDGTNYNTTWSSLTAFLTKAGNLDGLTDLATARDNLNLGVINTPVFGGVDVQGSGANVAHLSPTALSLNQTGHGQFTIQPSQGIVWPDASIQTTAWNDAPSDGTIYGRQDGDWVEAGGGDYLPLAGGAMDANASITASDTGTATDSEMAGWGLGVQLSADHTKGTTVEFNGLDTYDGASHMQVTPTGITFPDSSVQTTAALPLTGGTMDTGAQIYFPGSGGNEAVLSAESGLLIEAGDDNTTITGGKVELVFDDVALPFTIDVNGITFPDATVQTTAFAGSYLPLAGGTMVGDINFSDTVSKIIQSYDGSEGGTIPGDEYYSAYSLTGLTFRAQNYSDDGEGGVNPPTLTNGSNLSGGGLSFVNFNGTARASTMLYGPTSITFGNASVQTIAFPGFNNTALTGNPTAPTPALADNDTSIATTAFVQQELASGTANARNLEVYVRNQTGSTIPIGSIVYINGATGNRPTITLAQANNDTNSAQTIGFTKTAIANNGFGFVIIRGELEGLNTNSLTEGVQLYLSPTTAGTWTTTKPSAPSHLVYVGIVIRSHPTLGVILVSVQNGYELAEIHDVALASVANNDLLTYESSTDLWKNKSFATLGLATLASPALTGNVTINSSTGAALFIEQTGTGNILTLHDQASDTTFVAIDANGKVNTIASTTANAGLNIPHGTPPTTPVNGDVWTTTANLVVRLNGTSQSIPGLGLSNTFSGSNTFSAGVTFSGANSTFGNSAAASTINLSTGATTSGVTKAVNVGTGGLAGSTTTIAIGSTTGTSTTTFNGNNTFGGPITAAINNVTLGSGAGDSVLAFATGATASGLTKAVNVGTGGLAGSTTNIAIGSTTGTSTTTLQGITNGVTQTVGDNSTKLATTAFVNISNLNPPSFQPNVAQFSSTVTGTGSSSAVNANGYTVQLGSTAGSYATRSQTLWPNQVAVTGNLQWTRPVGFGARIAVYNRMDANAQFGISFGQATATLATPTVRSIGCYFAASAANTPGVLVLEVHNGTTYTTVNSSYTPTFNLLFDVVCYSDGAGNVTLYVNGSQVATTSAGPSTNGGATYETVLQAGYKAVGTPTGTSNSVFQCLKYIAN